MPDERFAQKQTFWTPCAARRGKGKEIIQGIPTAVRKGEGESQRQIISRFAMWQAKCMEKIAELGAGNIELMLVDPAVPNLDVLSTLNQVRVQTSKPKP